MATPALMLLRIPPFPRARFAPLMRARTTPLPYDSQKLDAALRILRQARVGGTYWGKQVCVEGDTLDLRAPQYKGCDPWHLFDQVERVEGDAKDERLMLACMAGKQVLAGNTGKQVLAGSAGKQVADEEEAQWHSRAFAALLGDYAYICPFTQHEIDFMQAVALLQHWRSLIDTNRQFGAIYGVARWKQDTLAALLWDGSNTRRFRPASTASLKALDKAKPLLIWKSRVPARFLAHVSTHYKLAEVEDGFIRSHGLGADCVPPLSIIVDREGIYFDPSAPSDMENLLRTHDFTPKEQERAEQLRARIVTQGVSKYERGGKRETIEGADSPTPKLFAPLPAPTQPHILVTGQVEDDRSIISGTSHVASNLALLQHVRRNNPHAYIRYKPHPDVEAGHRKGAIEEMQALDYADEIVRTGRIADLIDAADEVHVMTSLAGFEALLRGKSVTTYGAPFYAGWGLTQDLGEIPPRRTRALNLEALVATTYLLYPRYIDPITGLPCAAEIVLKRLAAGISRKNTPLVALRRLQGRIMKLWHGL